MPVPGRGDGSPAGGGGFGRRPGNGVSGPVFDAAAGGGVPGLGGVEAGGGGLGDGRLGGGGDGAGRSLVRPYAVTGGRTRPRTQLEIEAMVAAAHYEARDLSVLSPECQAILGFCRDWRSVAEVSAVLRMPLGVARILIADMAVEGLVRIHQLDHAQGRPDLNLLERVLSGLRKL
jgi:Protein of unknown function (DUF742)